ncbi:MAG: hypothetical protein ABR506_06815 [Candidatus Krumholzibacteriia bacterium]
MTKPNRVPLVGAALVALMVAGVCAAASPPAAMETRPVVLTADEAQTVKDFEANLADYLSLHRKLEASLPALPTKATPDQIDANQRALGDLIRTARTDAKQGDFFSPDMLAVVGRALASALAGSANQTSLDSITDENPPVPGLTVNARYPKTLPLTTMPLQVLTALPRLAEGLEYRFAGDRLILMDTHANLVIDFTDNVLF